MCHHIIFTYACSHTSSKPQTSRCSNYGTPGHTTAAGLPKRKLLMDLCETCSMKDGHNLGQSTSETAIQGQTKEESSSGCRCASKGKAGENLGGEDNSEPMAVDRGESKIKDYEGDGKEAGDDSDKDENSIGGQDAYEDDKYDEEAESEYDCEERSPNERCTLCKESDEDCLGMLDEKSARLEIVAVDIVV